MTIPLTVFTGVEADPVMSSLSFVVVSLVFLFSDSCSHNCSDGLRFGFADRATHWPGGGLERINLYGVCQLAALFVMF